MFSFLIFIGFSIIILGVYLEKPKEYKASNDSKDIQKIMERIINIEAILYGDNPKQSSNENVDSIDDYLKEPSDLYSSNDHSFQEVVEEVMSKSPDPFEVISLYESGKYSLEEACKILDMQKGEVLLLKNLYKESQK